MGSGQGWVRLPDLKVARRQLGCAVVKDRAGRLGVLGLGGTGDLDKAATAVEFYHLQAEDKSDWETWPDITTARCCWPQVRTSTTLYPPPSSSINLHHPPSPSSL